MSKTTTLIATIGAASNTADTDDGTLSFVIDVRQPLVVTSRDRVAKTLIFA
ncbi:hypothetical protein [Burkholderia cenocepacia]|uniref:hypothetical protein n=1 Tax=Burkholderia cenocepacia TaxID=95486 RepID=UPI002AB1A69D|nr:hypothetical protein [Burkholderia cenocepacia]